MWGWVLSAASDVGTAPGVGPVASSQACAVDEAAARTSSVASSDGNTAALQSWQAIYAEALRAWGPRGFDGGAAALGILG